MNPHILIYSMKEKVEGQMGNLSKNSVYTLKVRNVSSSSPVQSPSLDLSRSATAS